MTEAAVLAVRDLIVGMFPDPVPPRCGISVCGGTRLGIGSLWPIDTLTIPARCGLARCGASYVGRIIANNAIFAGMLPRDVLPPRHHRPHRAPGRSRGPRQQYGEAYDNPGVMVRIVGDDMVTLDRVADAIRRQLDGGHHLTTARRHD